jgi:hypothetical protein
MAANEDWIPLRNVLHAQMNCSGGKVTSGEELWAAARRRSWSSHGGAEEREYAGVNEV